MLEVILSIAFSVLVVLLIIMGRQLRRAYRVFKAPEYTSELGREIDLPSVTVCIPARNEQHALTHCLEQVVASTYEKLEIIVLDDVSGDDTSALIKSFATEGVRFVKGSTLPDGWLGKNHALQGLLEEASGTFVLFMDVDTCLAPQAIEHMVRYALAENTAMLSVLPRREDNWRASIFLSPLRYFWELVFNRKVLPATASGAWLIRRKTLTDRFGGFERFKNAIQPESKIAAELAKSGEYRFLIGSEAFGVAYEKKWRSQLITGVRLLFPVLNNDTALAFVALIDLSVMLLPFIVLVSALFTAFSYVHVFAFLVVVASYMLYGSYTKKVWKHGWIIGMLLWPVLIIQEMLIIFVSIIQYTRHKVTWKGRVIQPEVRN